MHTYIYQSCINLVHLSKPSRPLPPKIPFTDVTRLLFQGHLEFDQEEFRLERSRSFLFTLSCRLSSPITNRKQLFGLVWRGLQALTLAGSLVASGAQPSWIPVPITF